MMKGEKRRNMKGRSVCECVLVLMLSEVRNPPKKSSDFLLHLQQAHVLI